MDACPADNTKRSRFGHTGSCGSKRRNCCQRVYATGAIAIGVPGCPELAACTASMASVRIVLMHVRSILLLSRMNLIPYRGCPRSLRGRLARVADLGAQVIDDQVTHDREQHRR